MGLPPFWAIYFANSSGDNPTIHRHCCMIERFFPNKKKYFFKFTMLRMALKLTIVRLATGHPVCFHNKTPNLGQFWRVLDWKILVYFTTIGNILWPLGIFCGHLVYFLPFWYFVPRKIWQPCCHLSPKDK
jgi:hypothetical protein